MKFRRRRFTTWLSDAILENRSYDAVVRDLVADQGLWTDHPATNFVSVTFSEETELPDPERLAAAGVAGFPGRPARLCPVSRPPVPTLEAGRLSGPGRVLWQRPLEPARRSGWRKHVPPAGPQDQASRDGRTARAVPSSSFCRVRAACGSSLPAGSSTRAIPTWPAPRSTGCGPCSSAVPWSIRSMTCRPRASCRPCF